MNVMLDSEGETSLMIRMSTGGESWAKRSLTMGCSISAGSASTRRSRNRPWPGRWPGFSRSARTAPATAFRLASKTSGDEAGSTRGAEAGTLFVPLQVSSVGGAVADGANVRGTGAASAIVTAPYPGARPFLLADQDRFFGRDTDSKTLLELWQDNRITLLTGPVASGKTSLLNAGVLPLATGPVRSVI